MKWGESENDIKRLQAKVKLNQLLKTSRKDLAEASVTIIFTVSGAGNYLTLDQGVNAAGNEHQVINKYGRYMADARVPSAVAISDLVEMETAMVAMKCPQPKGMLKPVFEGKWFNVLPTKRGATGKRKVARMSCDGELEDEDGDDVEHDRILEKSQELFRDEVKDEYGANMRKARAKKGYMAMKAKQNDEKRKRENDEKQMSILASFAKAGKRPVPIGFCSVLEAVVVG